MSEQDTRRKGGTPTDVSFSNGVGSFNGSTSKIEYTEQIGIKSVRIKINLATTTEDILKLSSSHSITVSGGTISANGFSSPTIYVDGVATSTISIGWREIIVTTATSINADDVVLGQVSTFGDFDCDLFELSNEEVTAVESSLLYNNTLYSDYEAFIMKIDTSLGDGEKTFTLPLNGSSSYDHGIEWGDGTREWNTGNSSITHIYPKSGIYYIKIRGSFPTITFNNGGDKEKLTEIRRWGQVGWTVLTNSFYGCNNLSYVASDNGALGNVTVFNNAWRGCSGLTNFPLLDTSSVTNFNSAWLGCSGLTNFPLLDTSSGTDFNSTWFGCSSLTNFPTIDVSSGTIFNQAWFGCSGLTNFPLLDTSSGTSFNNTWRGCSGLTSFPLLDTSSGTDFTRTWFVCSSLTNFPTIDVSSMTIATNIFLGTPLSTASYDAMLIYWDSLTLQSGVTFDANLAKYTSGGDAETARTNIVTGDSWTFNDGGPV